MITGDQTYLLLYVTVKSGIQYQCYTRDQLGNMTKDMADIRGTPGLLFANAYMNLDANELATVALRILQAPTGA